MNYNFPFVIPMAPQNPAPSDEGAVSAASADWGRDKILVYLSLRLVVVAYAKLRWRRQSCRTHFV